MANSMFVPISTMPADLDEVRSIIASGFSELSFPEPTIKAEFPNPDKGTLKDAFILVTGDVDLNGCWISINDWPEDLTGADRRKFMVDIKTRGDWTFAGGVAFAFCRFAGRVVFNDACELDGQETYTAESLRHVLSGRNVQVSEVPE